MDVVRHSAEKQTEAPRWDSNPHGREPISVRERRVCPFRHAGNLMSSLTASGTA